MQKEDKLVVESVPEEKNIVWNKIVTISIIVLLLAIIIALSLSVYDYIQASRNQTNFTDTNITDIPPINETPNPVTSCGDGKCNGTETYVNCPKDCKRPIVNENCTPECANKNCGDNGCGGSCGSCNSTQACNATGKCVNSETCTLNCTGKQCGSDGCGSTCPPGCSSGYSCNSTGKCVSNPVIFSGPNISQYGITWYFDKAYEYGAFVNGDYWVLDNGSGVNITSVGVDRGSDLQLIVNPNATNLTGINFNLHHLRGGQSLITIQNISGFPTDDVNCKSQKYQDVTGTCHIPGSHVLNYRAAVLTIVSTVPPSNAFRPPFVGNEKPIILASDLEISKLPKIEWSGKPSASVVNATAQKFKRPWIDYQVGWGARYQHPAKNMAVYGREYGALTGEGGLLLAYNYTDNEKRELLINYVQYGIDLAYSAKSGTFWPGDGMHMPGRKLPLLFTGWILNNQEITNTITILPREKIQEDGQAFYVTENPHSGSVWTFNGTSWVSDGTDENYDIFVPNPNPSLDPAPSNFDSAGYRKHSGWSSFVYYGHANIANKEDYSEYTSAHKGLPEWGIRHYDNPRAYSGLNWSAIYRGDFDNSANGEALAAQIYGLRDLWNYNAFFDYMDRHVEIDNSGSGAWKALRNNYGCTWTRDNPSDAYSNGHYLCAGEKYKCTWQASVCSDCVTADSCSDYSSQRACAYDPCNLGCNGNC